MCEFASWYEHESKAYFLTNEDLQGKVFKEYKKENENWKEDICGHGAILYFYPELKDKTKVQKEDIRFNTPKDYPKEMVAAIRTGKMTLVGIGLNLLNKEGKSEYNKIEQPALAEYKKIEQAAYAEYKKIEQAAYAEYNKIEQATYAEYEKIWQPAYAEYEKIKQAAYAKCEKIKQAAYAEYKKIEQPALAEYKKIEQAAFWEIFKQKKYRKEGW